MAPCGIGPGHDRAERHHRFVVAAEALVPAVARMAFDELGRSRGPFDELLEPFFAPAILVMQRHADFDIDVVVRIVAVRHVGQIGVDLFFGQVDRREKHRPLKEVLVAEFGLLR